MLTKNTSIDALIITLVTGVIGIILFFGSIHGGGMSFYMGMVLLPPLYLFYAELLFIDNVLVIIAVVLLIQYLLWLVVLSFFKKLLGSNHGNSNTI